MIPNENFLREVQQKIPKDASVIVACQKGLRCVPFTYISFPCTCDLLTRLSIIKDCRWRAVPLLLGARQEEASKMHFLAMNLAECKLSGVHADC